MLKIDTAVAAPNQPYYYEENATVRVNANNDSLNEIRFQGTHLNITSGGQKLNIWNTSAFENATYALLSVVSEDYDFESYGNTFLHQQGGGIILTVAYNQSQNDAGEKALVAKEIFSDTFNVTLYDGTQTSDGDYHIFTFINEGKKAKFNEILNDFWDHDAKNVTSGFAGLLTNQIDYIKGSEYAKLVMGFVNKTRKINDIDTSLREVFFLIEYLDDDILNLSTGNYTFSMNEHFDHTGTDISKYNPSNSSTINVYLPTPLEPDVIDPNLSKFYDDWSVTNGSISLTLGNNNATIENLNATFTVEGWPCLLVEKSVSSIEGSYSHGETFDVEVSITNIGNGNASDVTIDDYGQWDADLVLDDEDDVNDTKGYWDLIEPGKDETIEYTLRVKNTATEGNLLLLKNSTVAYNFSSEYVPTALVQLNATSNTLRIPIEMDYPSLITTKTVTRVVYSTGEKINVIITISNPSDMGVDNNVTVTEYIPGSNVSSISNNTSILSSRYDSGGWWVNFTLEPPDDHSSIAFSYIFYPLDLDKGILFLNQSKTTTVHGGKNTTALSNSLKLFIYPRFIRDTFHHAIRVEADFSSVFNPETTMIVNVTITNYGDSPGQFRVINREPYDKIQPEFQPLIQTAGDNDFTKKLDPGESITYNYTYSIPDMEGVNFLYAPILVVSLDDIESLTPVIALSEVENIHINRRPKVDSVSFNATKLDRVKETVLVEASCSDHETPRAQLTVVLRINDSDDRLYNITMTFDEKTNLFVGNFTPGADASTGTHTFRIYATDQHDLTGRSSYYNFTVKNTKPRVEWMELYETNVTVGDTIKGTLGVKEVETPLFNLNISLYCSSPNVSIVYYGTLSLFESRQVDQYYRVGTFDIEIDTSNWQEGTYDVYVSIEDDKTSITYYYGEITVQRDDSPFYANPNLIFGIAYNIGVILFLIFQFRGFALLLKREIPF